MCSLEIPKKNYMFIGGDLMAVLEEMRMVMVVSVVVWVLVQETLKVRERILEFSDAVVMLVCKTLLKKKCYRLITSVWRQ